MQRLVMRNSQREEKTKGKRNFSPVELDPSSFIAAVVQPSAEIKPGDYSNQALKKLEKKLFPLQERVSYSFLSAKRAERGFFIGGAIWIALWIITSLAGGVREFADLIASDPSDNCDAICRITEKAKYTSESFSITTASIVTGLSLLILGGIFFRVMAKILEAQQTSDNHTSDRIDELEKKLARPKLKQLLVLPGRYRHQLAELDGDTLKQLIGEVNATKEIDSVIFNNFLNIINVLLYKETFGYYGVASVILIAAQQGLVVDLNSIEVGKIQGISDQLIHKEKLRSVVLNNSNASSGVYLAELLLNYVLVKLYTACRHNKSNINAVPEPLSALCALFEGLLKDNQNLIDEERKQLLYLVVQIDQANEVGGENAIVMQSVGADIRAAIEEIIKSIDLDLVNGLPVKITEFSFPWRNSSLEQIIADRYEAFTEEGSYDPRLLASLKGLSDESDDESDDESKGSDRRVNK